MTLALLTEELRCVTQVLDQQKAPSSTFNVTHPNLGKPRAQGTSKVQFYSYKEFGHCQLLQEALQLL